jgi:hypothetical protein
MKFYMTVLHNLFKNTVSYAEAITEEVTLNDERERQDAKCNRPGILSRKFCGRAVKSTSNGRQDNTCVRIFTCPTSVAHYLWPWNRKQNVDFTRTPFPCVIIYIPINLSKIKYFLKLLSRVGGVVRATKMKGSSSHDWVFSTTVTISFNHIQYRQCSAIANIHTL